MDRTEWIALLIVGAAFALSLWMLLRPKGCGNRCPKGCPASKPNPDFSGEPVPSKKSTQI